MASVNELNPRKKSCTWRRSTSGHIRRTAIKDLHCAYLLQCSYLHLPMAMALAKARSLDSKPATTERCDATFGRCSGQCSSLLGLSARRLPPAGSPALQGASSQRSFLSSSDEIAAIVELALLHEEDLVVDTEAFVLGEPHATEAEFLAWASSERAMTRFPELLGFGEALIVPASQLKAFADRARTESNTGFPPPKSFVVTPPGDRPFYCFSVIGLNRTLATGLPPGSTYARGRGQGVVGHASLWCKRT